MITLTRFCSRKEADWLRKGYRLYNFADHWKDGRGGSMSMGFCFTEAAPSLAWEWLKGIVTPEMVMVLRIPRDKLTESRGRYRDNGREMPGDVRTSADPGAVYRLEWCTTELIPAWVEIVSIQDLAEVVGEAEAQDARYAKMLGDEMKRQQQTKDETR